MGFFSLDMGLSENRGYPQIAILMGNHGDNPLEYELNQKTDKPT
jgi:hypothetical protein